MAIPKIGAALIAILMVTAARTAQAPQYQEQWLRLDFVAGLTLANSFHEFACMYQDLGADYFDRINAERLKHYLVQRLESLGQKVTLEPRESAA